MTKSVIRCVEPFFLKVLNVLDSPAQNIRDLDGLQEELTADLAYSEKDSLDAGLPVGDWDTIKRVLVYWTDEVLTYHTGSAWSERTLEHAYFGEKDRAWKFYVLGEQTIPTSGSVIAEVFYLAIALGFVGRIDEAFVDHLNQGLPGGRQGREKGIRDKARRHWARKLQSRIRHQAVGQVLGEPLEGSSDRIDNPAFLGLGLVAFVLSFLTLAVVLYWRR